MYFLAKLAAIDMIYRYPLHHLTFAFIVPGVLDEPQISPVESLLPYSTSSQ